jgi:hypothetical protein
VPYVPPTPSRAALSSLLAPGAVPDDPALRSRRGADAAGEVVARATAWVHRPPDQRFPDLPALGAHVDARTQRAQELGVPLHDVKLDCDAQSVWIAGSRGRVAFTHHAFAQFSAVCKAPAGYLRTLPPDYVVRNLTWGLRNKVGVKKHKLLIDRVEAPADQTDLSPAQPQRTLRAVTGMGYGRIWDREVVAAVRQVVDEAGGQWTVPGLLPDAKSGDTSLYASDHDLYVFLVDAQHPIEVDGEDFYPGIIIWNSETGTSMFGATTFIFEPSLDARIIYQPKDVARLLVRHTKNGPERFAQEVVPALKQYTDGDPDAVRKLIVGAKRAVVGYDADEVTEWLRDRGFTRQAARIAAQRAVVDVAGVPAPPVPVAVPPEDDEDFVLAEDDSDTPDTTPENLEVAPGAVVPAAPVSLWAVTQALHGLARETPHTDRRQKLEGSASRLLSRYALRGA